MKTARLKFFAIIFKIAAKTNLEDYAQFSSDDERGSRRPSYFVVTEIIRKAKWTF